MFDLISDNWGTIKDVLAGLAPILAALGVRRRLLDWWKVFAEKRAVKRTIEAENRARRQQWYTDAYNTLIVNRPDDAKDERLAEQAFHGWTIQQACARMGEAIPEYMAGWERVKVGKLN